MFRLACDNEVALEMNGGCFGRSEREDETQIRFFRLAKQAGCKVSPGSDAHTLEAIGRTAGLAAFAAEAGFTAADVIDVDWLREHKCR